MVFLGYKPTFFWISKHGNLIWFQKKLNFVLIWPQHFYQPSSDSFRYLFANFKWACTCIFFSRGTLWALHDFSSLRRSVTNGLGDCGPSCFEIINKLLPYKFWIVPSPFSSAVLLHVGRFCWELETGEIDRQLVFHPFSYYRMNSWLLTELVVNRLEVRSSYTILSSMPLDNSSVLPIVERLYSDSLKDYVN